VQESDFCVQVFLPTSAPVNSLLGERKKLRSEGLITQCARNPTRTDMQIPERSSISSVGIRNWNRRAQWKTHAYATHSRPVFVGAKLIESYAMALGAINFALASVIDAVFSGAAASNFFSLGRYKRLCGNIQPTLRGFFSFLISSTLHSSFSTTCGTVIGVVIGRLHLFHGGIFAVCSLTKG
jgi:hypothetical protein